MTKVDRKTAKVMLNELLGLCDCTHPKCEEKRKTLRAAVLDAMTGGVPEGYVLVPKVPTPEMIEAGLKASHRMYECAEPADTWNVMIAAGPQKEDKQ